MLIRWFLLWTFVLVATGGQAGFAASPATGELRGRIEDSVTRRPVAGAVVRLLHPAVSETSQQSDAEGAFVFSDVPEGIYAVEVNAPQHLKAIQSGVRVVLNKTAAVESRMARRRHSCPFLETSTN